MNNKKYEGFTTALALVDTLPVLFFGASVLVIGLGWGSPLFIAGASLAFLAGAMKVTWKFLLGTSGRDIVWLNKPFRCLMAGGFLLMVTAVVLGTLNRSLNWAELGGRVLCLPQVIFFAIWLLGLMAMCVLGKKLDSSIARNNWIEQCTNALAQLCGLIGILLCLK